MNADRAPLPTALFHPPKGRVVALAPHADDEVIGCGGTLALHAAQGDLVSVLIAFDGAQGGDPELRECEARAGGQHLGLGDYRFLRHPEGHAPRAIDLVPAVAELAARIVELAPDLVYAPWSGEHHLDHHVLSLATRAALELAGFEGEAWGYEVWTPLQPLRIVDVTRVYDRKVAALREHRSQLVHTDLVHKALGLSAHRSLYLEPRARFGEAFAPLGACGTLEREIVECVRTLSEVRRAC